MDELLQVLIVDDDQVDRMAVRRALNQSGMQISFTEAENFTNAIAILETTAFDCIFLDYGLPDQTGLALVQAIRQIGIMQPLVVLTGQGDEQIAVDLMKAGAVDYLIKSRLSPETLSLALRNAVRTHRAEMQAFLANQKLQESHQLLVRQNQALEEQRQRIQLQNLQLIEAARLKSQFLAMMSHELRTPLNAILGFSQLLQRPNKAALPPKQVEMVQRIHSNGKHLLEMINEILDLSKIEVGRLELDPAPFNLRQVINSTLDELHSLLEEKNLRLVVRLDLTQPEVFNDAGRVRQVLVNLLSNAIKFTERGQIEIAVQELGSDRLAISIRDTGIGIAESELEHIFEAFRQVNQTTTRRHLGTGLGLAITDSLVKMMSGTIAVESQVRQGSTFRIELPRSVPMPMPSGEINAATQPLLFNST
ncbi:MAG: response regulator [Aphanocapsa sp. GSE-SYN-MK-11-07L]|jgi:signal transduction histidine kinase|nr:response regulator [Aphanocapsa sp. GSE-SYN-MK-11-07L]